MKFTIQLCYPKKCHFLPLLEQQTMFVSSLPASGKKVELAEDKFEDGTVPVEKDITTYQNNCGYGVMGAYDCYD